MRKPTQKEMLERVYLDIDFITNKMSVNGSMGIHGILKDHHAAIQSLQSDAKSSGMDIKTLMEVTETERVRFDLRKKFNEYRKISPVMGAILSVVKSREFIIILLIITGALLGISDGVSHVLSLLH
jgi:hypothetical protein